MAITVNPAAFFDVTIGVTLVGLAVTASLFGVSTAQALWYYKTYPRDRRFIKLLVGAIWGFDALHLLLYIATMWTYLVQKQVQALGPTTLPWESSAQLLCNACAIVTIQLFYTYRIWTLSKSQTLAAMLAIVVLGDFALALTLFVKTILTDDVQDFIGLTNFDVALSSVTAIADVLLSGTLVILLALSRTGSAGANRLINKLVLYTINTGLLTSVFAIFALVAVIVLPTTAIYVMFYYIGTRLYSVSLLATLNARASLRIQAERIGHVSLPRLSSVSISRKSSGWARSDPLPRDVVVAIQHDEGPVFEDERVKEEYRRRYGAGGEELPSEVDESASSFGQWEPVKAAQSRSDVGVPRC
ncbi:hypothetical protein PYCCODRAFT_1474604 [Trametes coccinea BRFM310]|uniref:DUF6534 domain-containing protein n=1 Tax=Trametes coccinea (strain BRFM310) TaxID=1353009 RepID=A0A1Y2J2N6_TRAC3|nr:hypothetical protein PYCCODRAFT_1474604 [Trametes coccinea BRFM310]